MKAAAKLAAVVAVSALALTSVASVGAHPGATAYGRLCHAESRRHVADQKGTPFSQCVTAMARLSRGQAKSPAQACKGMSKRHIGDTRHSPYSLCVTAAAHLRRHTTRAVLSKRLGTARSDPGRQPVLI